MSDTKNNSSEATLSLSSIQRKISSPLGIICIWLVFLGLSAKFSPSLFILGSIAALYFIIKNSEDKKRKKARDELIGMLKANSPEFQISKEFFGTNNETGLLLDSKRFEIAIYKKLLTGLSNLEFLLITHRDVIKSEVVIDGGSETSTVRSSQLVGAVVGNVLAGGAGLIVGGLSGKNKSKPTINKVSVDITVNKTENPLWTIILLDSKKEIDKNSAQAAQAIKLAKEIHAHLATYIRKADDEDKLAAPVVAPTTLQVATDTNTFDVDLAKISKLKEQGVLSEAEFIEMKKAVLERAMRNLAQ